MITAETQQKWTAGACAPLPMASVISIAGADARTIVNNLTTNDVSRLPLGHSLEAFVTDVRGWVVALVNIVHLPDDYLLISQLPDPAVLVRHVDRYIVREDAVVRDRSADFACYVLTGQATDSVLGLPTPNSPAGQFPPIFESICDDSKVIGLHAKIISDRSKLTLVARTHAKQFEGQIRSAGIDICDCQAEFEAQRIRAFWPLAGREITSKTLPQELDRDATAISFTKGCYLGQETVARLDARGQLQKKLCLLSIAGPAESGGDLTCDGKLVGTITSSAPGLPFHASTALAFIKRGYFDPGTRLDAGTYSARVLVPHSAGQ